MTDEDSVPERFRPALEGIVRRLAAGDYDGVAQDHSPHVGQEGFDLGMWARDYPDTFVPLPPEVWEFAEAGRVKGRESTWWVIVPLWGAEEGQTDMSLEALVWDTPSGVEVEVSDLHVM